MQLSEFNYIDIITSIIVLLSAVRGLVRGFSVSLLSLLGWIASIYLPYYLFPYIEPYFAERISSKLLAASLAYFVPFIFFIIAFTIGNTVIKTLLLPFRLGFIDNMLGALFGTIQGMFIIVIIFSFFVMLMSMLYGNPHVDSVLPKSVQEAQMLPLFIEGRNIIFSYTPNDKSAKNLEDIIKNITHKDISDRYTAYMHDRLKDMIPEGKWQSIRNKAEKLSINHSEKYVQEYITTELIKAYKTEVKAGNIDNKAQLTKLEIDKLRHSTKS